MNLQPQKPAFTLIELLVVITIIVVLLALLTPALDKAIYQAELAVCASNQRSMVTGVTSYAMEFKRYYPHRSIHESEAQYRKPNLVRAGYFTGAQWNDMAVVKPWVPVKLMLDPLNGGLTVDMIDASMDSTNIHVNYMLWWDWQYGTNARSSRLGRSFGFGDDRFDVLTSEEDMMQWDSRTHNSHPDSDGRQALEIIQDGPVLPQGTETLSRWRAPTAQRGTIDGNYGYQDGSVSGIRQVTNQDERMARVPDKTDRSNTATVFQQIPERSRR